MKTYMRTIAFITLFTLPHTTLLAQGGQNTQKSEPSAELRESMAQNHEKMAICLRDKTKSLSECRQEMMDSCQASGSCMMMKHGGGKKGKGGQN